MSWSPARISDLVEAKVGFASGDDPEEGVFQFRMHNIRTDGTVDLTKRRRVPSDHGGLDSYYLEPGDVLFNATNSPELVGKSAFVGTLDEPAVFSNHFIRLRPRRGVDGRFLARWLTLQYRRKTFESMCRRWVNQAAISRDRLLGLTIEIPPIEEQRRIADILDAAEVVRAKRRATISQLDSLRESMFLSTFHVHQVDQWPMTTIEQVADTEAGAIRTGPFGSQLLHGEFTETGVAVLGIDNAVHNEFRWAKPRYISEAKYQTLKRYTVHPGDVLITIMGTCGRCAVVPDDIPVAINTKHLCCISLDQSHCLPIFLHDYFLYHPLSRHHLRRAAKGAVMDGLNMKIIRNVPLKLPPLEVQTKYASQVAAVESRKALQLRSLSRCDDLFVSLEEQAFRGEL